MSNLNVDNKLKLIDYVPFDGRYVDVMNCKQAYNCLITEEGDIVAELTYDEKKDAYTIVNPLFDNRSCMLDTVDRHSKKWERYYDKFSCLILKRTDIIQ